MSDVVNAVPCGFQTITPHLVVPDSAAASDFYQRAFGAQEICRMPGPGGKIVHMEMKIGSSMLMLADEFPQWGSFGPKHYGGTPVQLHLYVENTDATFQRAVEAGAQVKMPPADMFWGDRYAKLTDPFGLEWSLATHQEDVAPEEMMRRMEEQMKQMQKTECATV
jgi:uncharacterized glyoxalase superfamily protein PhnB